MNTSGPSPNSSLRSIALNVVVEGVVAGHDVILSSLDWFSDLRAEEDSAQYLDVSYRFVPPLTDDEHWAPVLEWKVWELDVQDDLGTEYDSATGGLGREGGDREIHPAPPAGSDLLTLVVSTPLVAADGELVPSTPVKTIQVHLSSGEVSVVV